MHKIDINTLDINSDKEACIRECTEGGELEIEFHYQAVFNNAKILRDFVRIICTFFGLPDADISRMILVIDELNNNAIEYGSMQNEDNIMRVMISKKSDILLDFRLEVQDTGNGIKHKSAEEMRELQRIRLENGFNEHKSIRGRGLFLIILKIVDELYFENSLTGGLIVGVDTSFTI